MAADHPVTINAVSGYSGGGKALIAEFEEGGGDDFYVYALTQAHKHVPEIVRHGGLTARPVFSPAVGRFRQGMIVQVPLHLDAGAGVADAHGVLANHYAGHTFVSVRESGSYGGRVGATSLVGTNRMELSVHGSPASGHAVATAVLDNLGKGASGAAVQNLNIMLGCAEDEGL
jgi:N-acetyl-gamma-glutamyl-phosphate reductase